MQISMIPDIFYDQTAENLAKQLLGKVIYHQHQGTWLSAQIIETESYGLEDKASHASLGFTKKREALFMPPGTIYMYYSRGKDSMNISCRGAGAAVLIKSGVPFQNHQTPTDMIGIMQKLNPLPSGQTRKPMRLCSGQTLLCQSMAITVKKFNNQNFTSSKLYIADTGYLPGEVIATTRLGIPAGRDEDLLYRFIDKQYAAYCTKNILTKRNVAPGKDYVILAVNTS